MAIKNYEIDGKNYYEVYVNGFDSRGTRVQKRKKGIETLRKAQQVEFELKRELADMKENRASYTWQEWLNYCLDKMKVDHSPTTLYSYEKQLKKWVLPHWKSMDLRAITRKDIHELIYEKCAMITTPHTRKSISKMVNRLFQIAFEEGVIERNPGAGFTIKVPEVEQKVLTNSEVQTFLHEARVTDHRFYPIWVMALMTGMRSGELYALKWSDIDFDNKTISVSRNWTNKGGFGPTKTQRTRIVPLAESLAQFLKEHRLRAARDSEFVLPHLQEWTDGDQARVTREFCAAIGVTSVKFHDLRATFITNLLARGESLARVMSIVGHSQLKTTNGYLRKAGVDVMGGTDKLGYDVPRQNNANVIFMNGGIKYE